MSDYPLIDLQDSAAVKDFAYKTKLGAGMTEDEIKAALKSALEGRSYEVDVAWGRGHGADITATLGGQKIIIEVKPEGKTRQQLGNHFTTVLGQILTRMQDSSASFGIALPAHSSFIELALKLPKYARQQLRLDLYFVKRIGTKYEVGVFRWHSD